MLAPNELQFYHTIPEDDRTPEGRLKLAQHEEQINDIPSDDHDTTDT